MSWLTNLQAYVIEQCLSKNTPANISILTVCVSIDALETQFSWHVGPDLRTCKPNNYNKEVSMHIIYGKTVASTNL